MFPFLCVFALYAFFVLLLIFWPILCSAFRILSIDYSLPFGWNVIFNFIFIPLDMYRESPIWSFFYFYFLPRIVFGLQNLSIDYSLPYGWIVIYHFILKPLDMYVIFWIQFMSSYVISWNFFVLFRPTLQHCCVEKHQLK